VGFGGATGAGAAAFTVVAASFGVEAATYGFAFGAGAFFCTTATGAATGAYVGSFASRAFLGT